MGRSFELYAAQQERDEAAREALAELLVAGKHLAIKLAEAYSLAGISPARCPAIREFMRLAEKIEGRA